MLIELIIEFKWKGPGPPGRTCSPTTSYFHDEIGVCKKNHRLSQARSQKFAMGGYFEFCIFLQK